MILSNRFAKVRMRGEEGGSEETCRDGTGEGEDEPNHADAAGSRHQSGVLSGHKTNQNMRLAEVTQTPRKK